VIYFKFIGSLEKRLREERAYIMLNRYLPQIQVMIVGVEDAFYPKKCLESAKKALLCVKIRTFFFSIRWSNKINIKTEMHQVQFKISVRRERNTERSHI
jgi:hypothetical protein